MWVWWNCSGRSISVKTQSSPLSKPEAEKPLSSTSLHLPSFVWKPCYGQQGKEQVKPGWPRCCCHLPDAGSGPQPSSEWAFLGRSMIVNMLSTEHMLKCLSEWLPTSVLLLSLNVQVQNLKECSNGLGFEGCTACCQPVTGFQLQELWAKLAHQNQAISWALMWNQAREASTRRSRTGTGQ